MAVAVDVKLRTVPKRLEGVQDTAFHTTEARDANTKVVALQLAVRLGYACPMEEASKARLPNFVQVVDCCLQPLMSSTAQRL